MWYTNNLFIKKASKVKILMNNIVPSLGRDGVINLSFVYALLSHSKKLSNTKKREFFFFKIETDGQPHYNNKLKQI